MAGDVQAVAFDDDVRAGVSRVEGRCESREKRALRARLLEVSHGAAAPLVVSARSDGKLFGGDRS